MITFIQQHLFICGLWAYFLFSNAVGAMEKPDDKSTALYRYVYRFGHGLAGNLKYAMQAKFSDVVQKDTPTP